MMNKIDLHQWKYFEDSDDIILNTLLAMRERKREKNANTTSDERNLIQVFRVIVEHDYDEWLSLSLTIQFNCNQHFLSQLFINQLYQLKKKTKNVYVFNCEQFK